MSNSEIIEDLNNNSEIAEPNEENKNNQENNEKNNNKNKIITKTIELKSGKTQRSDKTKFERTKDAKQRAIDNFKRGIADPEYRVVKMSNDKFRCYKRKESLPPEPIKLNQVPPNKPSSEIQDEHNHEDEPYDEKPIKKQKDKKEHDPFSDIVYFNMSNQISEQLNKRLDAVNAELDKLKQKNSKLKGKYKALKQAIYITEEEDVNEVEAEGNENENENKNNNIHQTEQEPQQLIQQSFQQVPYIARSNPRGINFNRFFQ